VRRLNAKEIDEFHKGNPIGSVNPTDHELNTIWDATLVALVTFALLLAVRDAPAAIRELWFMVAYVFTATGVAVAWAKVRDRKRRSDYHDQLSRRLTRVAQTKEIPTVEIGVTSLAPFGTREEAAFLGNRPDGTPTLVAIRTRRYDQHGESWEDLLAFEIAIEKLERRVGLRPEEPELEAVRARFCDPPERRSRP